RVSFAMRRSGVRIPSAPPDDPLPDPGGGLSVPGSPCHGVPVGPEGWTPRGAHRETFDGPGLDPGTWLPHYLPAWSSRDASAATYEVRESCLHLWIPPDQGLWCHPDHQPPLRVSGVQSGNHSGPVGSTRAQQPYREGLTVREEQQPFAGWLVGPGELSTRLRMSVSPRSMAALWLVGIEDVPERSAEI